MGGTPAGMGGTGMGGTRLFGTRLFGWHPIVRRGDTGLLGRGHCRLDRRVRGRKPSRRAWFHLSVGACRRSLLTGWYGLEPERIRLGRRRHDRRGLEQHHLPRRQQQRRPRWRLRRSPVSRMTLSDPGLSSTQAQSRKVKIGGRQNLRAPMPRWLPPRTRW